MPERRKPQLTNRKPRRPRTGSLAWERAEFIRQMDAVLYDAGAIPTEKSGVEPIWARMYPLALKTPVGWLLLKVHVSEEARRRPVGGWVAGRFLDVPSAVNALGADFWPDYRDLNPFTGKWNHHYNRWTTQAAVESMWHSLNTMLRHASYTRTLASPTGEQ